MVFNRRCAKLSNRYRWRGLTQPDHYRCSWNSPTLPPRLVRSRPHFNVSLWYCRFFLFAFWNGWRQQFYHFDAFLPLLSTDKTLSIAQIAPRVQNLALYASVGWNVQYFLRIGITVFTNNRSSSMLTSIRTCFGMYSIHGSHDHELPSRYLGQSSRLPYGWYFNLWTIRVSFLTPSRANLISRWSFFRAVSQMLCIGYGQFPPSSMEDMYVTTLLMLLGAICFAVFIGYLTSIIQSHNSSKRLYAEKYSSVKHYMIFRKLPMELRKRISDYYENRYQGKSCFTTKI